LKVVDFGIAVQMGSGERQTKGTLHYLPPELLQTVLDGSAASEPATFSRDVWALGCMLFEMGYGRTPFVSERDEKRVQLLMRQIANPASVVPYSDVPAMASLNACVRSCLRFNPAERPTVTELLKHPFLQV
jgi:serine/threonine protein kinase